MDFAKLTKDAVARQTPPTDYRLAKVLGVQPSTVHHWKNGTKKPTGENLLRLLQITGKMAAALAVLTITAVLGLSATTTNANAAIRMPLSSATSYTLYATSDAPPGAE